MGTATQSVREYNSTVSLAVGAYGIDQTLCLYPIHGKYSQS